MISFGSRRPLVFEALRYLRTIREVCVELKVGLILCLVGLVTWHLNRVSAVPNQYTSAC